MKWAIELLYLLKVIHMKSNLKQQPSSGGVACLIKESLRSRVSMVAFDEYGRFMWIQIRGLAPLPRHIYITICYFPMHRLGLRLIGT